MIGNKIKVLRGEEARKAFQRAMEDSFSLLSEEEQNKVFEEHLSRVTKPANGTACKADVARGST